MASLAEKRMDDAEERPVDPNTETDAVARPEELRLLEALLFASAEPIESGDVGEADARRRRHQGGAGATASGIRLARCQPGARRQQVDVPHRRRTCRG